MYERKKEMSIE